MKTNYTPGSGRNGTQRVRLGLAIALALLIPQLDATALPQAPVDLGSAANFAVLAGPSVSITSGGTINGDLGTSPGNTYTPGGVTLNGSLHLADGVAGTAQNDLTAAYNDAFGRLLPTLVAGELGTPVPYPGGLYKDNGAPASLTLTGTMTLDALGDPSAVWIFQSASTIDSAVNSRVILTNGAQACNVFWVAGSAITIGVGSTFAGNLMAAAAITLGTGATLEGRVLAANLGSTGAGVTLDGNTVSIPACGPSSLIGVPANTNAACDAVPLAAPVLAGNSCSTGTASPVFVETVLNRTGAGCYTLQRVWTASNSCGDKLSATQMVFVTDTTAPILFNVPANTNATCDALPPPANVTATDSCSTSSVTVVFVQSLDAGGSLTNYTLRRTWSASDGCGNSTSAVQLLVVTCDAPAFLLTKSLVTPTTGLSVSGTVFQFDITVLNNGVTDLRPTEVRDVFNPDQFTFVTSAPNPSLVSPGLLIWTNFPIIAPGVTATVTVSFVTSSNAFPATLSNTAIAFVSTTNGVPLAPQTSTVVIATTYMQIGAVYGLNVGGAAVIAWEADGEDGTAGYILSRRDSAGRWSPVSSFIPAAGDGRYGVRDRGVAPGSTAVYRISEIENRGARLEHGPFTVTIPLAAGVGLSLGANDTLVRVAPVTLRARSLAAAITVAPTVTNLMTIKASVSSPGLHQIGVPQLAAAFGRTTANIGALLAADSLAVFNLGQPVPSIATAAGLSFYGAPAATIYSDHNVYWITIAAGRAFDLMAVAPAAPVAGGTFASEQNIERNLIARPDIFDDPSADIWLWQGLTVGGASSTCTLTFDAPGVVAGSAAILNLRLKGGMAGASHEARLTLNGVELGSATFSGLASETDVSSTTALLPFGNQLTITAAGDSRSAFFVDGFTLQYRRSLTAVSDSLLFDAESTDALTVGGFSGDDIEVFAVTDAANPVRVTGASVSGSEGSFSVSFMPGANTRYLATRSSVRSTAKVASEIPSQLAAAANRADYLIITAPGLKNAAKSLAAYRAGRGLTPMVVDVQDIHDEFGYGITDPRAIVRFLSHARFVWALAPRYVVFLGDGSLDFNNHLGLNECAIPGMLLNSVYGLHVSDAPFADLDNDGVLDLAVGRLPVATEAEAFNVIAKIKAFEAAGSLTMKKAVALADNSDNGGNFAQDSDQAVVAHAPGINMSRIHLGSAAAPDATAARTQLFAALNNGAGLLTYFGHSSRYRFAGEQLLTRDDVAAHLSNASRPAIVAAMTCLSGDFGEPGLVGLGETLLASPNGAVAVIGSGAQVYNAQSRALAKQLVSALYEKRATRLGDALTTARNTVGRSARAFNLLGDPALELKTINTAAATAGNTSVNDFDGDGSSDIATYRTTDGQWNVLNNSGQPLPVVQFGRASSVPVAADYDGDGIIDHALFQAASGTWFIRQSSNGVVVARNWGWSQTLAVPADYDGDGKADLGVYHPATGTWYLKLSSNAATRVVQWGSSQAIPVPGDFDGDGRADLATYTRLTGQWNILQSKDGNLRAVRLGSSAAIPTPCDYDGDRMADIATYTPASGLWTILQSSDGSTLQRNWGWSKAAPVPADYDDDGKADFAVFAPATGVWYIRQSATGTTRIVTRSGTPVMPQFQINRRYFPNP